jgi:hypothetical protein
MRNETEMPEMVVTNPHLHEPSTTPPMRRITCELRVLTTNGFPALSARDRPQPRHAHLSLTDRRSGGWRAFASEDANVSIMTFDRDFIAPELIDNAFFLRLRKSGMVERALLVVEAVFLTVLKPCTQGVLIRLTAEITGVHGGSA